MTDAFAVALGKMAEPSPEVQQSDTAADAASGTQQKVAELEQQIAQLKRMQDLQTQIDALKREQGDSSG